MNKLDIFDSAIYGISGTKTKIQAPSKDYKESVQRANRRIENSRKQYAQAYRMAHNVIAL